VTSEFEGKVLIVDDHPNVLVVLQDILEKEGLTVLTSGSYDEALPFVEGEDLDVIITDLKMPGRSGMDLLNYSRKRRPDIPVIMLSGHGDIETAVTAMKNGAFDFISKPVNEIELIPVVRRSLSESGFNREIVSDYFEEREDFDPGFIGTTPAIEEIFRTLAKVAPTDSTVLITGETGVGKELIARSIHLGSPRKGSPFIKVHCAAIPETLVESELFGFEKGAFTGAISPKPGRFELADGGTLFLDEVGEIPLSVQVKLLTVLQDHTLERVGGVKTRKIDIRIVAATNMDLQSMVDDGSFRRDLFYRLNVVPVSIPPLRERKDDIALQAEHFLKRFSSRYDKKIDNVPDGIMDAFVAYNWPGNTRELENVVERLVVLSESGILDPHHLPGEIASDSPSGPAEDFKGHVGEAASATEKRLVSWALKKTGGNRTRAAELLGISRRTLYKKIKDYGL
jgi:two-component system response regulator AtoC